MSAVSRHSAVARPVSSNWTPSARSTWIGSRESVGSDHANPSLTRPSMVITWYAFANEGFEAMRFPTACAAVPARAARSAYEVQRRSGIAAMAACIRDQSKP